MKIDEKILKFPKSLPNDVEGLMNIYPSKFPGVVKYFEEQAEKFIRDPEAYKNYAYWAQEEMFAGFEVIKLEYENGNKNDLAFLVDIEQKLSKLFCYRFWVVNYLFADGLWHEYFVDNLKASIRKFVEIQDDVEEYELNVLNVQRDLLQTDYADLYLKQALNGVRISNLLLKDENVKDDFLKVVNNFSEYSKDERDKCLRKISEYIINLDRENIDKKVKDDSFETIQEEIRSLFLLPLNQVQMRKSDIPLIAFLTHVVEFEDENKKLLERHNDMKNRIGYHFNCAKKKLSSEEFSFLKLCYEQSRNLTISKDIMGEIDPFLLPFWFGEVHRRIREIVLSNNPNVKIDALVGHGGMFSDLVWYLPNNLKAKVMTPDHIPYIFKGDIKRTLESSDAWNAWDHAA